MNVRQTIELARTQPSPQRLALARLATEQLAKYDHRGAGLCESLEKDRNIIIEKFNACSAAATAMFAAVYALAPSLSGNAPMGLCTTLDISDYFVERDGLSLLHVFLSFCETRVKKEDCSLVEAAKKEMIIFQDAPSLFGNLKHGITDNHIRTTDISRYLYSFVVGKAILTLGERAKIPLKNFDLACAFRNEDPINPELPGTYLLQGEVPNESMYALQSDCAALQSLRVLALKAAFSCLSAKDSDPHTQAIERMLGAVWDYDGTEAGSAIRRTAPPEHALLKQNAQLLYDIAVGKTSNLSKGYTNRADLLNLVILAWHAFATDPLLLRKASIEKSAEALTKSVLPKILALYDEVSRLRTEDQGSA